MALQLHRRSIALYGGTEGIRDQGALESALAQAEATFGGALLHPTLFEQAAAYLFHIAKNHPFLDGNKRTALACAAVFLEMNGHELPATANDALEALTLGIADGSVAKDEVAGYLRRLI